MNRSHQPITPYNPYKSGPPSSTTTKSTVRLEAYDLGNSITWDDLVLGVPLEYSSEPFQQAPLANSQGGVGGEEDAIQTFRAAIECTVHAKRLNRPLRTIRMEDIETRDGRLDGRVLNSSRRTPSPQKIASEPHAAGKCCLQPRLVFCPETGHVHRDVIISVWETVCYVDAQAFAEKRSAEELATRQAFDAWINPEMYHE